LYDQTETRPKNNPRIRRKGLSPIVKTGFAIVVVERSPG
jgi:hypothetical protein